MDYNIYLTGFSGTGKTTSGKALAGILRVTFIDMDYEIENIQGKSIPQIFDMCGEDGFRKIETKLLKEISNVTGRVVSTGGGVPAFEENRRIMSDAGKIICLTAKPEILLQRLKGHAKAAGEKAARPMLLSDYPLAKIRRLLSERESSYSKSDLVVNTEFLEPEAVAKKIIERLSL